MLNKIFQLLLRTVLLYFFLTLIYISGINSSRSGYIEPRSISVIEGSNVTFQCNFNSSLCSRKCFDKLKCDRMDLNGGGGIIVDNICIHFGYNNKTTIAKEYITVINSSTVALNLINTQPMNEIIKCHCNDCTIDGSDIYVEKRLEPVNDFECSSYDFSYMNCSFSTSEYLECNFYSLYYMISTNLKNGSFESSTSIKCNLKYNNDEQKCFCKIEGSDYYQFYQYYIFNLNASSKVQQHIQEFRIKQIEIMKPQNPQFKLIEKTSNSLKLEWKYKNAKYFKNFNVSILFNVTYYPRLELNKVCGISSTNVTFDDSNIKYIIELKGLEYSYTNYTIEIIVQTKSENNAPTLESKQILLLETAARAPDTGPKVLPGSFYIDENNKKIRLYWQPLQKFQENGQNITYIIKEVFINDEQDFNWRPEHININSALYVGYEIKNKYEFHIYSKNEIGESKNYSSIFVPKRINIGKNYDPLFVAKIINRNIYEIIWTEPTNINELVNYSLFWCKTTEEMSPNVCENIKYNSINFKEVKKSENSYSFTIDNHNGILNLGISANYKNFSSGIIWAPCMADKNDDFPIVEILKYDSGKNFIKIFWNSQCKYEPLIENYDIKYCHGINNISNNIECESGTLNIIKINKNINLNSKSFKSYTIKNLQPYQKYLINIRMSSKLKTGPYLKYPLFIYTEEDAPSSPRNLKLLNLTDNSATIEWNSPKTSNGLIKSYEILLYDIIKNDNIKNITLKENQFKQINNSIQFKIIDLKSYNSYKVFIIAKTKYSSNLSNGLEFNTTVGYPGSLQRGNLKKNNEKKIITWNSPIDKGAETISYYQIIVTLEQLSYISIVQQKHCTLKYSCDEFQKNSEIKIYAVSINAIPKETFIRDNMTSFVIQQCEKSFTPENKNFLCEENISTEIFTEEY